MKRLNECSFSLKIYRGWLNLIRFHFAASTNLDYILICLIRLGWVKKAASGEPVKSGLCDFGSLEVVNFCSKVFSWIHIKIVKRVLSDQKL